MGEGYDFDMKPLIFCHILRYVYRSFVRVSVF